MATVHKERLTITVQGATKRALENLIPVRQRSAFTENALRAALREEAKRRALDALGNRPSAQAGGEQRMDSVTLVRQIRANMGERLSKPDAAKS